MLNFTVIYTKIYIKYASFKKILKKNLLYNISYVVIYSALSEGLKGPEGSSLLMNDQTDFSESFKVNNAVTAD